MDAKSAKMWYVFGFARLLRKEWRKAGIHDKFQIEMGLDEVNRIALEIANHRVIVVAGR